MIGFEGGLHKCAARGIGDGMVMFELVSVVESEVIGLDSLS